MTTRKKRYPLRCATNRQSTNCSSVNRSLLFGAFTIVGMVTSHTIAAQTILYRDSAILLPLQPTDPSAYVVTVDNKDVTLFSTVTDTGIMLDLPFPEKKESIEVVVTNTTGSETLYRERYRKARATEVFDTVNTTVSGQFNTAFVSESNNGSAQHFANNDSAQSDLLATLSIDAKRGALSTYAEIEGVNRTDKQQTVRDDGPNADISRFHVTTEYSPSSSNRFFISAGDTGFSAVNSLVNTGIYSRGIVAGFESSARRIKFEVGRLHGADIIGAVNGPLGWTNDSYRFGFNYLFRVIDTPSLNWNLHSSAIDVNAINRTASVSAL